ncbi:hypothetical protein F5Y17DRAFT_37065 [Xylariaceae sp. FL0594]|nr:hypothetical protein F5Y17DRAFT_37065 [Xylariaceae sp. FL0594]
MHLVANHFTLSLSTIYPFAYLLLSFLIFHITIRTPDQQYRLLLFPFFLVSAIFSFTASANLPFKSTLPPIWTQSVALNIIHITSLLFIEKHPPPSRSTAPLRSTYQLWSNPQLKPSSSTSTDNPLRLRGATPTEQSHTAFLTRRFLKLLSYYALYQHIQPRLLALAIGDIESYDVASHRFRDLELSPRGITIRSYVSLSWAFSNYIIMDSLHAALSIVAVITSLDRPEDWEPALFGPWREVSGLRNFWSRFWHRLARRPYTNCGRAMCSALGLNSRKALSKTVVAFIVFLVSGLSHAAVSWQAGWTADRFWMDDVEWYMLNFFACLFETGLLALARSLSRRLGLGREYEALRRSWCGWCVGCAWTFAFFFCTVPMWQFPRLHRLLVEKERWEILEEAYRVFGRPAGI